MQRRLAPLLVEGKSEREIAETIGRSRHTVHDHTKRIYRAFDVHTRPELAARWNGTVAWTGREFPARRAELADRGCVHFQGLGAVSWTERKDFRMSHHAADDALMSLLHAADPEVAGIVEAEKRRQSETIELIASENHVSAAVQHAAGSCLTNKYAEGYPGARYYGGCEHHDAVERLAQERAKQLFGCGFANVQPHSGAQANMAAFMSIMEPGDTFASLTLSDGGHLSHGMKLNFSGSSTRRCTTRS